MSSLATLLSAVGGFVLIIAFLLLVFDKKSRY